MADLTATSLGLDLAEVQKRIDAGLNLPSHCYTDPAVFDFEVATIFDNSWTYFAPLERVAEPGSVVTGQVGRVPVIVTRADDGELRGFVNACRHRGFTIVDEDKQCSRLQCPYHAWIYGLDGTLLRTPRAEDLNADLAELGLHPVAVAEWAHAIYINPNPHAPALGDAHPRLDEMADSIGLNREPGAYTRVLPLSDRPQRQLRRGVRRERWRVRSRVLGHDVQRLLRTRYLHRFRHGRRQLSVGPALPGQPVHPAGRRDGCWPCGAERSRIDDLRRRLSGRDRRTHGPRRRVGEAVEPDV